MRVYGPPISQHRSHIHTGLLVLVGMLALLLWALLVGGARSATDSPLIAFTRGDGVYVMRTDGSDLRAVRRGGVARYPQGLAWSPHGTRLAFVAQDALSVMDADGGNLVRLLRSTSNSLTAFMSPTWSPNGRRIAFTAYSQADRNRDVWVINADGTSLHRLARTPRLFEVEVDWSPVGNRIVVASDGYLPRLYVMNADGSDPRRLAPARFLAYNADWSPDGRRIAFTHDGEIYVVDVSSRSRTRLTHNAFVDTSPAWSWDETMIAFVRGESERPGSGDIYLMNADGTGERALTHSRAREGSPEWQPVAAP